MAKETITRLIDDLDGFSEADETVEIALDGQLYTLDLTAAHADELREVLAPYVSAGSPGARVPRGVGVSSVKRGRGNGQAAASGVRASTVREWARQNGYTVSDRGRVSQELLAKAEAAGVV